MLIIRKDTLSEHRAPAHEDIGEQRGSDIRDCQNSKNNKSLIRTAAASDSDSAAAAAMSPTKRACARLLRRRVQKTHHGVWNGTMGQMSNRRRRHDE